MDLKTVESAVTHVLIRGDEWRAVRWEQVDGRWRSSFQLDPEDGVVTFHGRGFSGDELSQFVTGTDEIAAVRVHPDPEDYVPVPGDFNRDAGKLVVFVRKDI